MKLYIFLRSDLESMTPGKAAAQVAHSASQAAFMFYNHYNNEAYKSWESQAVSDRGQYDEECYMGFGTTIVLDAGSGRDLETLMIRISKTGVYSGMVVDPSYPVKDGRTTHFVDIPTCGWALVRDEDDSARDVFGKLGLYNGNH